MDLICRIARHKYSLCHPEKIQLTFTQQVRVIMEELFQKVEKYGANYVAPETNYLEESSDSDVDSEGSDTERSSILTKTNIPQQPTNMTVGTN